MRTASATPQTSLHGDSGAIIPEFALIAPFLVLIVLGIFEFGMAWRESLNLSGALRSAARVEGTSGRGRATDYLALQAFATMMAGAKQVTVNRVVVYKATGANGAPSNAACLTTVPTAAPSGIPGACNIYAASQISNLGANYLTNFGPNDTSCGTSAWDYNWCPLTRLYRQADPPDYVGVYANISYQPYTKILPGTVTITDRVVMRIDPEVT